MKATFLLAVCAIAAAFGQSFQEDLDQLVSICSQEEGGLDYVREYWIREKAASNPLFRSICSNVSTNWSQLRSFVPFISTNESRRLVFSRMIGHVGADAYLQVCNDFVAYAGTHSGSFPMDFIMDIASPPKSPLEYYIPLHHDDHSVSNLAIQARALFPAGSSDFEYWTDVLSGNMAEDIRDLFEMQESLDLGRHFISSLREIEILCLDDPDAFDNIQQNGFGFNVTTQESFRSTCLAISSSWDQIAPLALKVVTDEKDRFLLPRLVGYSGTNGLIAAWSSFLEFSETNSSAFPLSVVMEIASPQKSPLQYYVPMSIADPTISNLVQRSMVLFPTNTLDFGFWTDVLSGKIRSELLGAGVVSTNETWEFEFR